MFLAAVPAVFLAPAVKLARGSFMVAIVSCGTIVTGAGAGADELGLLLLHAAATTAITTPVAIARQVDLFRRSLIIVSFDWCRAGQILSRIFCITNISSR